MPPVFNEPLSTAMEHQQHQIPVLTSLANFAKQASAPKSRLTIPQLRTISQSICAVRHAVSAKELRPGDSVLCWRIP